MKILLNIINAASFTIGWFLGGFDGLIYLLISLTVVDYAAGIMRAIYEKKLSSAIFTKLVFRKILVFMLIGAGNLIDRYLLTGSGILRSAIIIFYISNEGISILENSTAMGLPIPKKLRDALIQLGQEQEEHKEKRKK